MEKNQPRTNTHNPFWELSAALFELRDAFMELSMALKDRQFETDLVKRKNVEDYVDQLLRKL